MVWLGSKVDRNDFTPAYEIREIMHISRRRPEHTCTSSNGILAMYVASTYGRYPTIESLADQVTVFAIRMVSVDRFDPVKPARYFVPSWARTVKRPHGMCHDHGGAFGLDNSAEPLKKQQFRVVFLESVDKHMAGVGAKLHAWEHADFEAFREDASIFSRPDAVVFGEAHAIHPSPNGLLNDADRTYTTI